MPASRASVLAVSVHLKPSMPSPGGQDAPDLSCQETMTGVSFVRWDGPWGRQALQPRCARLRRFRVDPPTCPTG